MSAIVRALALAAVACAWAMPAYASEVGLKHTVAEETVPAGEYRDLTWYRQLKLGTAPYVNPQLLEKAVVVYRYDPAKFAAVGKWDVMLDLLKDGHVTVAMQANGTYEVAPANVEAVLEALGTDESAVNTESFVLLTGASNLGDIRPENAVVSWDAGDPAAAAIEGLSPESN